MLPSARPNGVRYDVGRRDAQPIEVRVDDAGRDCERDIAVVAGMGGTERAREPVVRALRDERAGRLVAVGVAPPGSGRSKMHAVGTIGTGPVAVGYPCPRAAR